MISNPRVGQIVQLWYAAKTRAGKPWHGRTGVVRVVSKARRARNHGVEIDGQIIVVPAGNLRKAEV